MKKQVKVLATAALLAMGATMTSFAAEKGTWDLTDEGWVCYDEDGDTYENEWCLSNGKEYYVGDDGIMVTSGWVEDDDMYFVNSAGQKIVNDWKLTTPYDDEDADEEWFYFDSKGKRVESKKKVIDGKTYYFDSEGVMLTGWVEYVKEDGDVVVCDEATESSNIDDVVYCDENGARVKSSWIKTWAPGTDEDDADEDDQNWYWIKSAGAPQTGKNSNINGSTYFFGEDGAMLSGWVVASGSDAEVIYEETEEKLSDLAAEGKAVYFCGDEDDGHVKKNTWVKEWRSYQYEAADSDVSKKWFWISKTGEVFVPNYDTLVSAKAQAFDDGESSTPFSNDGDASFATKTINSKTYAFNKNGDMISGLVKVDANQTIPAGMYYFGESSDGSIKDGSQTIEDDCGVAYKFYFSTETKEEQGYYKNVGVTGAKSGKLYNEGLLVTSGDAKYDVVKVNELTYIVNKSGSIQTTEKTYKDGDDVVIDASDDADVKVTFHKNDEDKGVAYGHFTTAE